MDLTAAIAPKSDQLNAEDLLTGERTFTIASVEPGSAEQPVNVHLVEMPGRPWRPSKSMSRVMAYLWGPDTEPYASRHVTLYRDPEVTFGRDKVGGIKIAAMSHIDAPKSVSLTVTRGKRAAHTVKPLVEAPPAAPPVPVAHLAAVEAAFTAAGIDQGQWLTYAATVLNRAVTAPTDLTEDDAHAVIAALQAELDRRDTAQTGGE